MVRFAVQICNSNKRLLWFEHFIDFRVTLGWTVLKELPAQKVNLENAVYPEGMVPGVVLDPLVKLW